MPYVKEIQKRLINNCKTPLTLSRLLFVTLDIFLFIKIIRQMRANCHMGHAATAMIFLFLLTALRLFLAQKHLVPPSSF